MLLNEKTNKLIFNKSVRFKYSWRKYQIKFLRNFEKHSVDKHLHVIAPPGAGKTILGIEMLVRVDKKTLVLAPSLTIRNQWKQKFHDFFDSENTFGSISTDIRNLKNLNFNTYQGVFSLRKEFESSVSFVQYFKDNAIEVLVLDEAHHLKSAWWKVLMELKENTNLIIISLTATPPFDSSNVELHRYFSLCGEIDEEISIPELVQEKALCPHQDFIYFSKPEKKEIDYIFKYRMRIATFINYLKENRVFIEFIKNHPYYTQTENSINEIYKDPSYFSAILIFLNSCEETISIEKLKILGFEKKEGIEFPVLDRDWIELLLQKVLFDHRESLIDFEEILSSIEKDLRKIGGIHHKRINLLSNEAIFKKITNSANKLNSIVAIVKFEEQVLKNELRLVVLTDFIRKEFLGLSEDYTGQVNKIGVVPVFHYLKKYLANTSSLAILSGSLIVVNKQCLKSLFEHYSKEKLHIKDIKNTNDFVEIIPIKSSKNKIVGVITQLFEKGIIKILIGTKSLLGEGWDAPSINSLILASNIGSYVSSNQMRGRAIRVHGEHKTGHIWHLASIDPTDNEGGSDVRKLTNRFDAFVGLDYSNNVIKTGISRLNFPFSFENLDVEALNQVTLKRAENREQLKTDWKNAIGKGTELKKIIKFNYLNPKKLTKHRKTNYKDLVRNMFIELSLGVSYFFYEFVLKNIHHILIGNFGNLIKYFIIGLFMGFLPRTIKAIRYYFIFGNAYQLIEKISDAILFTMKDLELLKTSIQNVKIEIVRTENGNIICSLNGASYHENSIFVSSVNEILAPIENPKYLIVRNNWLKDKIGIYNVHAVPKAFENKKSEAQIFYRNWKKKVGKSNLVYGRNNEGRKLILKARLYTLKYFMKNTSKEEILWK